MVKAMEIVARVMQNESVTIGIGIAAMVFAFVGFVLLTVISVVSVFVHRAPGGILTLTGILLMLAMFSFAQIMTSSMGLQYGPAGEVAQAAVYTYGGFLCVLGYARLSWHFFRNHRRSDQ